MDRRDLERLGHHVVSRRVALGYRNRTDLAGSLQFTVWGGPDTVRECLYVDDQIAALLAADGAFENAIVVCGLNGLG